MRRGVRYALIATTAAVVVALAAVCVVTAPGGSLVPASFSAPLSAARWERYSPERMTLPGLDSHEYDGTCVALIEHGQVTMVACPDGRVGWFG